MLELNRTCLVCGKKFHSAPSCIKRGGGKYCSSACRENATYHKISRVCEQCGKEFKTYRGEIAKNHGRFCSRDCARNNMQEGEVQICPICKNEFYIKRSDLARREIPTCSKKCMGIASRGREVSPEVCLHISQGKYGKPLSEEHKRTLSRVHKGLMTGANHPQWRGGISFEPYCPKFNEDLKEKIRNEYNRTCQICGEKEGTRKLSVHHVNFDKKSGCFGRPWNLLPLDGCCHTWTSTHRFEAFNLLACHWLTNSKIHFGVDDFGIFAVCLA